MLALILLVLLTSAFPAAAAASSASTAGSTVTIVGGPESSNILAGTGSFMTGIRDSAGITAGSGCSQLDSITVSCGDLVGGRRIDADLGAGNDIVSVLAGNLGVVHGGPGSDEINADGGNNSLYGDDGQDTLFGLNGNDLVDGGTGSDQLYGDGFYYDYGGNDTLNSRDGEHDEVSCGLGVDVVTADALDNVYVECDQVDRGRAAPVTSPPTADRLPTMTVSVARWHVKRGLGLAYRAWRKGTRKVIANPRRVSRIAIRFKKVSVRYRGRTYRGWAQAKYYWKNREVWVARSFLLR